MTAFIALTLSILSPAYAWDCTYWSQSTDPTAECYKAPQAAGTTSKARASANQRQRQNQQQRQRQSQVAKGGNATAAGGAGGTATVGSVAGGSVGDVAGGAGGMGGSTGPISNDSTSAASNQGNSQSTQFQGDSYPRQTPAALAGFVQPTSTCTAARNGGASSPVAGISFGVSTKDEECDLRETARMFFEMGQAKLGVELLCKSKAAGRLHECGYVDPPEVKIVAPPPTAVAPPASEFVTKEEFNRFVRQALGK